jgi:hypothetical protein
VSANDAFGVVVSMLQRKVARLGTLQSLAETGRFRNDGRLLAELQDASVDVCQLTYVLFAMDRRDASGNLLEDITYFGDLTYADIREVVVRDSLGYLSVEDGRYTDVIREAVENASRQTVAGSDLTGAMQRGIFKLQEDVAGLKNLSDATRPAGLVSIVMRVGLATIAAAGAVAPVTALVFNYPTGRKMLEAALGTFISVALVEAGTAGIDAVKNRQTQTNRKSEPDIRQGSTVTAQEMLKEEPNVILRSISEEPVERTQEPPTKIRVHTMRAGTAGIDVPSAFGVDCPEEDGGRSDVVHKIFEFRSPSPSVNPSLNTIEQPEL